MALFGVMLIGPTSLRAEPVRTPNRFLFIIDASAGMKPYENAVREAMFDFISIGLRGQMTNNDTYGLWLVNEQNDTSFQMEIWRQKFAVEMAAKAAAHIKKHGFKGKLNLAQAQADLGNVIKNVDDLTIILITNGETPISGTPFDDAINIRFRELAATQKKARAPIYTTFAARDGELLTWAPSSPEGQIRFPVVPKRPEPAKVEVAAEPIEPATVPVAPRVEPVKPKATAPAIIITKESVAQEKKSYQTMTTTSTGESPATPTVTNAVAAQPPVATNEVAAIAVTASKPATVLTNPAPAPAPPVASTKSVLPPAETNRAVAARTSQPVRLEPTLSSASVAAAPVPPRSPVPAASAKATPAAAPAGAVLWAVVGAGGALLCVLVVFLACRSRRPAPSLISQSLVREQASRSAA